MLFAFSKGNWVAWIKNRRLFTVNLLVLLDLNHVLLTIHTIKKETLNFRKREIVPNIYWYNVDIKLTSVRNS